MIRKTRQYRAFPIAGDVVVLPEPPSEAISRTHRESAVRAYRVMRAARRKIARRAGELAEALGEDNARQLTRVFAATGARSHDSYYWNKPDRMRPVLQQLLRTNLRGHDDAFITSVGIACSSISRAGEELRNSKENAATLQARWSRELSRPVLDVLREKRAHYAANVIAKFIKAPVCGRHTLRFTGSTDGCGVEVDTGRDWRGSLEDWHADWWLHQSWMRTVLRAGIAVPKVNHLTLAAQDMGESGGIHYWKARWARCSGDWDLKVEDGTIGMRDGITVVSAQARNIPRLMDAAISRSVLKDMDSLLGGLPS